MTPTTSQSQKKERLVFHRPAAGIMLKAPKGKDIRESAAEIDVHRCKICGNKTAIRAVERDAEARRRVHCLG